MSPAADSTSSPPRATSKNTKVSEGRVEKPRTKKGESKVPNYSIDGRTFACESCKKGHRVSKCTHALQRPVHMTNDPGRPPADQKRHCDCPRQCSCTKKNCKCDRTCNCTQVMYMLVYIPFDKGASASDGQHGEWRIDREVITDLKGNRLTDEEIRERAEKKALQKDDSKVIHVETPSTHTTSTGVPNGLRDSINSSTSGVENESGSCCKHRKAVEEMGKVVSGTSLRSSDPSILRPQCNCGSACACAFCFDHPNNTISQDIARRQAAYFAEQQEFDTNHSFTGAYPSTSVNPSCMGTSPQFAMLNDPNPSSAQLLDIFGNGTQSGNGYVLSYPVTRFPELENRLPGADSLVGGAVPCHSKSHTVKGTSVNSSSISEKLNSHVHDFPTFPNSAFDFPSYLYDPTAWGIGDASVSSLVESSGDTSFPNVQWSNPSSQPNPLGTSIEGRSGMDSIEDGAEGLLDGPTSHLSSFSVEHTAPAFITLHENFDANPTINFEDFLYEQPQDKSAGLLHQPSCCCRPSQTTPELTNCP